ncbi:MAG TPA: hypothetical protein VKD72_06680, partial [Gemmataceae bacterium]|nr:hypothetical protein [Gemmataceae bacterium]
MEGLDWHRTIEAGCCCALRLCYGYDAEEAERKFKNRMDRLERFMNARKWKQSRNNPDNIWRDIRLPSGAKLKVTIFKKAGRFGVYFEPPHWDKYDTQVEAMRAAFELVESLRPGGSPRTPVGAVR